MVINVEFTSCHQLLYGQMGPVLSDCFMRCVQEIQAAMWCRLVHSRAQKSAQRPSILQIPWWIRLSLLTPRHMHIQHSSIWTIRERSADKAHHIGGWYSAQERWTLNCSQGENFINNADRLARDGCVLIASQPEPVPAYYQAVQPEALSNSKEGLLWQCLTKPHILLPGFR